MIRKSVDGLARAPARLPDGLSALLLMLSLWALMRQYPGVIADARYYLLVLLHQQFPDVYAADLYFKYGLNNRFTVFPYLHGLAVALAGDEWGTALLTIVGHGFWLVALWYLASSVFRDSRQALLAAGFAVLFPLNFGGIGLGESFLTPRIFGEAMIMAALGLLLRGSPWRSLGVLTLSMAMHPLMTLAGFLFWYLHQIGKHRRYLWLMPIGLIVLLGLSLAQWPPFDGLLRAIDDEWLAVVRVCGAYCFESKRDWINIFFWCCFLALVLASTRLLDKEERWPVLLSVAVMLFGRIINWIGTDLYPNGFILAIQAYRMGWLCSVMGAFGIAGAMFKIHATQKAGDRHIIGFFIALIIFWAVHRVALLGIVPSSGLAIALSFMLLLRNSPMDGDVTRRAIVYVGAFISMFAFAMTLSFEYQNLVETETGARAGVRLGLIALTGLGAFIYVRHMEDPAWRHRRLYQLGLLSLLVATALVWDQRSEYQKYVERREPYEELRSMIEPGEPIYWEGQVMVPWHVLRQQSYFSCEHGTGTIYQRELAMEYQRRWRVFQGIGPLDFGKQPECPLDQELLQKTRQRADLTAICHQSPGLRYLALLRPAADDAGRVWRSRLPYEDRRYVDGRMVVRKFDNVHLYDCNELRRY